MLVWPDNISSAFLSFLSPEQTFVWRFTCKSLRAKLPTLGSARTALLDAVRNDHLSLCQWLTRFKREQTHEWRLYIAGVAADHASWDLYFHFIGVPRSIGRHIPVEQGSVLWLMQRRKVTASSGAGKAGISDQTRAYIEWEWELFHKGESKPDPYNDMRMGHIREDPISRRFVILLYPTDTDPDQILQRCGMYLIPGMEDWLSASPDRILRTHRDKPAVLEIKNSERTLYTRPKIEHLVQVVVQMKALDADYAFLCYGHEEDNTAIFLVQYCPELFAWLVPRWRVYCECIETQQTPKGRIEELGMAVHEYWYNGHAERQDLPPQPRWQLIKLKINEKTLPGSMRLLKHSFPLWTY